MGYVSFREGSSFFQENAEEIESAKSSTDHYRSKTQKPLVLLGGFWASNTSVY